MLTLWGRLNSHNVKKVAWLAVEIGRPWRRIDIGGQFGFTDEYLAMNPNRLIPTIKDDDLILWESNAILRYLAAKYAPALWPADLAERARGDKWMDWQFTFADAQRDAFLGLVRTAPTDRDEGAIARSGAACAEMMRILDAELSHRRWLAGEDFGIADIPMGVYAYTYFTLAIERPALPAVEAWYERLKTRPGFAQVAIPLT